MTTLRVHALTLLMLPLIITHTTHSMESPQPLSNTIERALAFAAKWHDQTYRKSESYGQQYPLSQTIERRVPVITHLAGVAFILMRTQWDDDTVAAGLLHDTLEDPNVYGDTLQEADLRNQMGDHITAMIKVVSEPKKDTLGNDIPWKQRKEVYIKQLRKGNPQTMAISLADKIHNLHHINTMLAKGDDLFGVYSGKPKFHAGILDQSWYFNAVLETSYAFQHPNLNKLREQLANNINRFKTLTTT